MKTIALVAALLGTVLLAGCNDDSGSPPPADTPTVTVAPSTATVAPSTATRTPVPATSTTTPTATIAATPGPGGIITFFGVLRADNMLVEPIGVDSEGRQIYPRPNGSGFVLVVEARPGSDRAAVGTGSFDHDPNDPSVVPDLQILTSRALGDGSALVCDDEEPNFGGVPAVDPPDFDGTQAVADAINDFACRFIDGTGNHDGRNASEACSLFPDGQYRFVSTDARLQFCALISAPFSFPEGDTVLTARVRNIRGAVGPAQQIVVRVES